jgi:hypothetical protein
MSSSHQYQIAWNSDVRHITHVHFLSNYNGNECYWSSTELMSLARRIEARCNTTKLRPEEHQRIIEARCINYTMMWFEIQLIYYEHCTTETLSDVYDILWDELKQLDRKGSVWRLTHESFGVAWPLI